MIRWINNEITEIITKILKEIDININESNHSQEDSENFVAFNTYEKLKEKNLFTINLIEIYNLIPFFKYLEKIYDVDVPTEYPVGSITDEVKENAFMLKSIIYNFILSSYFPEIIWNMGDSEIYLPESYIKK